MTGIPEHVGPYEVVEWLGEGGAGVVVHARHTETGADVKLKMLHPATVADDLAMARIEREVELTRRLTHPGLERVYDIETYDLVTLLVSEYIPGHSLQTLLDDEPGPLPADRALRIIMQLTDALAAAHDEGVIHRDLKPDNIIVGAGDRVRIIDFGVATAEGARQLTAPGMIVGTIDYIAPETWGGKRPTPAADVWALGTIAYRLITGTMPFPVRADFGVYEAVRKGPARPIHEVAPHLPGGVAYALMGALRRTVANRYQNARNFHRALTQAVFDPDGELSSNLDELDPLFEPPPTSADDVPTLSRNDLRRPPTTLIFEAPSRWLVAVAVVVVLVALTGAAIALYLRLGG